MDRFLNWGRSWDIVHYLLSAKRRGEEVAGEHDDLIARAVLGGDALTAKVQEDQQFEIVRYMPPAEVHLAAEILSQVTEDQMRQHYDLDYMNQIHVYKIWSHSSGEMGFREHCEAFEEWRDFYSVAAAHDEGVIAKHF
jgi:hypothetical protein